MNGVRANAAGARRRAVVLDAGCGVGGTAIWLAGEFGARVVGITPVAGQVTRARRLAGVRQVADLVSFDQQDYRSPTFPDASFDVVWAQESVCHAPDKQSFVTAA